MTPEQITTFLVAQYVGGCIGIYLGLWCLIGVMRKFEDEIYANENRRSSANEAFHLLYFCCLDEKDGDKFLFYAGLLFNLIAWLLSLSILVLLVFVSIQ